VPPSTFDGFTITIVPSASSQKALPPVYSRLLKRLKFLKF
jgi:hypothetical protein